MKFFILQLLLLFLIGNLQLTANPTISKSNTLPKVIEYEGEAKLIYKINDIEGEHFLFVTRNQSGEFGSNDYKSEIRAYKFSKSQNGFQKILEIKDFSPNALTSLEWGESGLTVGDWDGDGIVEFSLFYELSPDGMDATQAKLISYYKNKKYAIRGTIPTQTGEKTKETFDKSISTLPQKIQTKLKAIWNHSITKK